MCVPVGVLSRAQRRRHPSGLYRGGSTRAPALPAGVPAVRRVGAPQAPSARPRGAPRSAPAVHNEEAHRAVALRVKWWTVIQALSTDDAAPIRAGAQRHTEVASVILPRGRRVAAEQGQVLAHAELLEPSHHCVGAGASRAPQSGLMMCRSGLHEVGISRGLVGSVLRRPASCCLPKLRAHAPRGAQD